MELLSVLVAEGVSSAVGDVKVLSAEDAEGARLACGVAEVSAFFAGGGLRLLNGEKLCPSMSSLLCLVYLGTTRCSGRKAHCNGGSTSLLERS